MSPLVHFIFSMITAVILYPIFGWSVLLIFVSGVLIDIDHYFWYIYKIKDYNMFKCYKFYMIKEAKNNYRGIVGALFIFHTIEILVILMVISFFIEIVMFLTIGIFGHFLLDLIWIYYTTKRFFLNHSIISWFIKNKIQKQHAG